MDLLLSFQVVICYEGDKGACAYSEEMHAEVSWWTQSFHTVGWRVCTRAMLQHVNNWNTQVKQMQYLPAGLIFWFSKGLKMDKIKIWGKLCFFFSFSSRKMCYLYSPYKKLWCSNNVRENNVNFSSFGKLYPENEI